MVYCSIVIIFGFAILTVYSLPDVVQMIKSNGYPAEEHIVTTSDGYYTVLHRIPHGKSNSTIGEPIFVAHGIAASSAAFVNVGPSRAFGYILADAGYDVWLSNCRGNSYSKLVTPDRVNTNSRAFNDYSFNEIGLFDYTAQIDYVLKNTGKSRLYYAGHSQGGTAFYAMISKKPEYNSKIRVATLFASPIFLSNTDITLRIVSHFIFELEFLANLVGLYSSPLSAVMRAFLPSFCSISINHWICRRIYNGFAGYDDSEQLDGNMLPVIFKVTPSDTSFKTLFHFGQIIRSGIFREYDYGTVNNLQHYSSLNPPTYNLSAVTTPIAIYYGLNDKLVHKQDILKGASLLRNVISNEAVNWSKWNHGDFINANDVVSLLYNPVLDILKNY